MLNGHDCLPCLGAVGKGDLSTTHHWTPILDFSKNSDIEMTETVTSLQFCPHEIKSQFDNKLSNLSLHQNHLQGL